mmetsp:Transcript_19442/g.44089  ORF Transcript_19442/g.44089 Transcript_19442/m.44089 type:complete len:746 (+) Transcript_19442:145-2382(+)|eukprot:CAMPEP_0172597074 /NCGR_PEP_ID=MMETSP1068-20121228/17002_1 /TAXON_ID=35684 /ORGANISM="Pseudopedinella elastica, Strain CCMP716" /LENGTH=745 /DNA_ID=CAMNT_0013396411 /DNA_START=40 /DNA_END=2277 /DNA_ORIENTATION=+
MAPRDASRGNQNLMLALFAAMAFAAGMYRGFSEPYTGSTPLSARVGETTVPGGPHSISDLERTLEQQQKLISQLVKVQQQQLELSRAAEQTTPALYEAKALAPSEAFPSGATAGSVEGKRADITADEALSRLNAAQFAKWLAPQQPTPRTAGTPAPPASKPAPKPAPEPELEPGPEPGEGLPKPGGGAAPVGHSHSAKGWEPAVVAHTLENVAKAHAATRQLLRERYGEALFAKAFRLDPEIKFGGRSKEASPATPVFLDPGSRELLVRRFLAKLAAPIGTSAKRFVVAFGGHSSAAAHGNLYNQSYAHAFERLLAPAFKAAGVQLVVRNHAMGGTGCVPAAYCVSNVFGADLDAISWDFGMTDGRNIDHAELYFRQAILQVAGSGARLPPLLMLTHNTDNPREEMVRHFGKAGFEVSGIRMNNALTLVPKTESKEHASTLPDALRYLECANTVTLEECKAHKFNCLQQCGSDKGKACHGQVSWHPGWRYHMLKGDLAALPILEALGEAAQRYQSFTMELGPNLDPELYKLPAFPAERPLPKPLFCGPKNGRGFPSSVDAALCSEATRCATSYEPRKGQGPHDLAAAAAAAASNPGKKAPIKSSAPLLSLAEAAPGWAVQLAPGEGDNTASCTGHVDQKFNALARQGAAPLSLEVETKGPLARGLLMLCEGPFSARFAKEVGFFNTSTPGGNVALELDGKPVHYQRKVSKSLCSVVSDRLAPGRHTLKITPKGKALTGFSHVIWL